jgi:hypothetical protein
VAVIGMRFPCFDYNGGAIVPAEARAVLIVCVVF